MSEKEFKQVFKCEHCGSEAEMMITFTQEEDLPAVVSEAEGKAKGHDDVHSFQTSWLIVIT